MAQANQQALVYLLDSDASVRHAISRFLHASGVAVRTFGSIDELLGRSIRSRRACVVADVLMPGDVGIDLPQRLHETGLDIPVILLSADDNGRLREAAKSAGAVGFFHKPVDGPALIDAIEWALDEPESQARPDRVKNIKP